jgi:hypothetical protein
VTEPDVSVLYRGEYTVSCTKIHSVMHQNTQCHAQNTQCHAPKYTVSCTKIVRNNCRHIDRSAVPPIQLPVKPLKSSAAGIDWIELAQDRDRWRALVSAVMNLWVP